METKIIHAIKVEAEAVSTELDETQYINTIVNIISKYLGYNLVGIFLFDQTKQAFTFKAGTGEIGQALLSLGHQIPVNQSSSLVGAITAEEIRINDGWSARVYRCSAPSQVLLDTEFGFELIADYSESEIIRPSYILPDRRWEVCLPLRFQEQLLGVMYYHINEFTLFSFDDCVALQWLADQVSEKLAKVLGYT